MIAGEKKFSSKLPCAQSHALLMNKGIYGLCDAPQRWMLAAGSGRG